MLGIAASVWAVVCIRLRQLLATRNSMQQGVQTDATSNISTMWELLANKDVSVCTGLSKYIGSRFYRILSKLCLLLVAWSCYKQQTACLTRLCWNTSQLNLSWLGIECASLTWWLAVAKNGRRFTRSITQVKRDAVGEGGNKGRRQVGRKGYGGNVAFLSVEIQV